MTERITLQEAVLLAEETARAVGIMPELALEILKMGYHVALNDAYDATLSVKVSGTVAAQKSPEGSTEVGKAVARRIIQDKLDSLRKKMGRIGGE